MGEPRPRKIETKMDDQPVNPEATPGELLAQLVDELSILTRAKLELAFTRRSPQLRRLGLEAGVAMTAAAALFLAVAAFSLAGAQSLRYAMPTGCASAIIGLFWLAVAIVLMRFEHPRRLVRRLTNETSGDTVARSERDEAETEQAMKLNAERLATAFAGVVAEIAVNESVTVAEKLVGAVERESEGVVGGLAMALHAPSNAGRSLLGVLGHHS